jgi:hypothetical protein
VVAAHRLAVGGGVAWSRRVLPSGSVNRNVTVPAGRSSAVLAARAARAARPSRSVPEPSRSGAGRAARAAAASAAHSRARAPGPSTSAAVEVVDRL